MKILLSLLLSFPLGLLAQLEKITFPAENGLEITADFYVGSDAADRPVIVLFHQAGSSRGEYREIAPRLVEMGFTCLAVDQRSGSSRNGVSNETAARARAANLPQGFLDAVPDLEAAIAKTRKDFTTGPVIIWGSSYSSALVLKLAGEQADLASAVLSFSPGEYFSSQSTTFIRSAAAGLTVPVFITSAKSEANDWSAIFEAIPAGQKSSFLPPAGGRHGASTLLSTVPESELYWTAVSQFLAPWLPTPDGTKIDISKRPNGSIQMAFTGVTGQDYRVSVSRDLKRWLSLTTITATDDEMIFLDEAKVDRSHLFYRVEEFESPPDPEVRNVTFSGVPENYQFQVTVASTETGNDQYADWWEVLTEDGKLLYRRVLGHPHVNEQPFTRSGGPVTIAADEVVWIRAHLNSGGYGKKAFRGSVESGFEAATLNPFFASEATTRGALPSE